MRKAIIILSLLLGLVIAGVLYETQYKSHAVKTIEKEKVEMDQFPEQMPDVVLHPMPNYIFY